MLEHHQKAVDNLVELYRDDPEVLGLVFGGSIVRGMERPDSDVDAVIVVTDERYKRQEEQRQLAFTRPLEKDHYEGGYYDLKYVTIETLQVTAEKGSEPARNAYVNGKVILSRDERIAPLLEEITRYPEETRRERIDICYAGLLLSTGYFWDCALRERNRYLLMKSACDTVLFGLRMLFAYNRFFFPCHRTMIRYTALLREKPEGIVELAETLLAEMTTEAKDAFLEAVMNFTDWGVDKESGYSNYINYFEKFWLYGHTNTYEM